MAKKNKNDRLSPPWIEHMSKLAAFFAEDKRIEVSQEIDDGGKGTVYGKIFFDGDLNSYDAFNLVFNKKVEFGKVKLVINVIPANKNLEAKVAKRSPNRPKTLTDLAALKLVLSKNPVFDRMKFSTFLDTRRCFCIFKPVVLQWYADNLCSPWKLNTGIPEVVADIVFRQGVGALFCTLPKEVK